MQKRAIFISAIFAFAIVRPLVAAEDARPRFSLREGEAFTGSNIKSRIVDASVIPFDKRYSELSPEQQGYLKSQYDPMGPADEPPYPLDGTKLMYQAIAAVQQRLLVSGNLTLVVDVNSQGEAMSVSSLESPDKELSRHVATILMLQKYKPALCDGKPCAMQFPIRLIFKRRL